MSFNAVELESAEPAAPTPIQTTRGVPLKSVLTPAVSLLTE